MSWFPLIAVLQCCLGGLSSSPQVNRAISGRKHGDIISLSEWCVRVQMWNVVRPFLPVSKQQPIVILTCMPIFAEKNKKEANITEAFEVQSR